MNSAPGATGLFAALKNSAATLVGIAQTRLALVSNELQVEKQRALRQLALLLAVLFCAGVCVLLLVAFATLVFWEQRLAVVGASALLFAALTAYLSQALKRSTASSEAMFASSLSELQKDMAQLRRMSVRPDQSGEAS